MALLVLALVPSAVVSAVALRQVIEINQLWQSAGMEDALTSSVSVARESVNRLETDLGYATGPIIERWRTRPPDLERDRGERLFVARLLRDLGLDFLHVYAPDSSGVLQLESAVAPENVVVGREVDLAPEIEALAPDDSSLRSTTGALAFVHEVAGGRRVAIGFLLAPDFFLRLSELQLGLGTIRALGIYARVFRTWLLALLAGILLGVAALAIVAATWLSRRLAGPVGELSLRIERMGAAALQPVPMPARATPEVRTLARALNALTARLRATQENLLRAERVAGSAEVSRQVAHEIKNALATVEYATTTLDHDLDALPAEQRLSARETLTAIRKEFEVLKDVAETFSLLGRMSEPLRREAVDMNRLAANLRAPFTDSGVDFVLELDPAAPAVAGDERALRRLLTNLVRNAIEAQPETPAPGLVLRTRGDGATLAVEVEDRGRGMPAEVRARVFDAGFSTKREPGSGFGLFLARSIAEQHGGTLTLDSEPERGTVARVRLPAHSGAAPIGSIPETGAQTPAGDPRTLRVAEQARPERRGNG